jgi:hypothetical protein
MPYFSDLPLYRAAQIHRDRFPSCIGGELQKCARTLIDAHLRCTQLETLLKQVDNRIVQ